MKTNWKRISNVASVGTYIELRDLCKSHGYVHRRMILADISILSENNDELIKKMTSSFIQKNDILLVFQTFKILNGIESELLFKKTVELNKFLIKYRLDIIIFYGKKNLSFFNLKTIKDCSYNWFLINDINFEILLHFGSVSY